MKVCVGVNLCPFPTEELQDGGCFERWEDFSFLLYKIQLVLYYIFNNITTRTTPETTECTTPIVIWTRSKMSLVNILTTQFFGNQTLWNSRIRLLPLASFRGVNFWCVSQIRSHKWKYTPESKCSVILSGRAVWSTRGFNRILSKNIKAFQNRHCK